MTLATSELIWDLGDRLDLRFTWNVLDGGEEVPTNPTTVRIMVRRPDGYEYDDTAASNHVTTGVYEWHGTLDMADLWYIRAVGTGAAEATMEVCVRVRKSHFRNP